MEESQYELGVAAGTSGASDIPELDSITLSPTANTDIHRRFWDDAFNPEDLALFTDTLFYDTDLERFLDGVTGFDENELNNNSTNERRAPAYEGQHEDSVAAVTADGFLAAEDYLGYDFLNFKIPDLERAPVSSPDHQHLPTTTTTPTKNIASPLIQHQKAGISSSESTAVLVMPPSNIYTPSHPQPPSSTTVTPQQIQTKMLSPREISSSSSLSPFTGDFPTQHHNSSSSPPSPSGHPNPEWAHLSIQEQAHLAAEEDKRRRNTAASARFRIKKKQRDQALERQTKEMADKVSGLEKKITQLELENRWLRNLLVEKNEKMMEVTGGIAKRNDGVGTHH